MGCAKTTLLFSNAVGIILAGGLLIGALYAFLGPLPEEAVGYVALVPDGAFYGFFAISGIILLLALVGCVGTMQHNKFLLSLYAVIVFVVLIAEAAVAAVLLTNYFEYSQNIGVAGDTINDVTRVIEDEAVFFALKNPSSWFTVQTVLGCCGYNFRTTYNKGINEQVNVDRFEAFVNGRSEITDKAAFLAFRDPLHSGLNCTQAGEDEIDAIRAADAADADAPTKQQQEAADNSTIIGLEAKYFCEEGFFSMARPYYTAFGATGAAIAVVLMMCMVSAFYLLCCAPEEEGGFKGV